MTTLNLSLVIGSNSFLGAVLCKKLHQGGVAVEGVFHRNTSNIYKEITYHQVDQLESLNENQYGTIFIVAAYVPSNDNSEASGKLIEANVLLVERIVQKFSKSRIIYCSSVSVYGSQPTEITEGTSTRPESPYALSKLWGEYIVKSHRSYAILRISSMYGPEMNPKTFIPTIIDKAIHDGKIELFGKGERLQNYIYVEDVANFLVAAAKSSENGVFLAVGSNSNSNREVAEKLSQILDKIDINYLGKDNSPSWVYDNSITKRTLQYAPKTPLIEGLKRTVEWMK